VQYGTNQPCLTAAWALSACLIIASIDRPGAAPWSVGPTELPHLSISGRVLDASTAAPIRGARVNISSSIGISHTSLTDGSGSFSYGELVAGTYQIAVHANDYLPSIYGQMWPGGPGRSLYLRAETRDDVTVRLWKPASVAGTVTTTRGEPIPSVTVELLSVGPTVTRDQPAARSVQTDKSGAFQFVNVLPGKYVVGTIQSYGADCSSRDGGTGPSPQASGCTVYPIRGTLVPQTLTGRTRLYATTFYPGSDDLTLASEITVRAGEQLAAIDFWLDALPTVGLSGAISEPTGAESAVILPSAVISLTRLGNTTAGLARDLRHAVASTDRHGRFVIPGVPPGDYELRAVSYPRAGVDKSPFLTTNERGLPVIAGVVAGIKAVSEGDPLLESTLMVSVGDSDIADLNMTLQRGSSVRGATVFGGRKPVPSSEKLSGASVRLQPVSNFGSALPADATLDAIGSFEFPSLASGNYLLSLNGAPGWAVESVDVNGRIADDMVVEIECCGVNQAVLALTDDLSSILGVVGNKSGQVDEESFVFLFPADSRTWKMSGLQSDARFRIERTAVTGSFTLSLVRPGDYFIVAASHGVLKFNWREPEALRRLSARATRVAIKKGQEVKLSLQPIQLE